jgi:hypothetical protein
MNTIAWMPFFTETEKSSLCVIKEWSITHIADSIAICSMATNTPFENFIHTWQIQTVSKPNEHSNKNKTSRTVTRKCDNMPDEEYLFSHTHFITYLLFIKRRCQKLRLHSTEWYDNHYWLGNDMEGNGRNDVWCRYHNGKWAAGNYEKPITIVGRSLDIRTRHLQTTSSKASQLKPINSLSYLSPTTNIATDWISICIPVTNTLRNQLQEHGETKTCFTLSVQLHSTNDNTFYSYC